jgi:hypothetical protein
VADDTEVSVKITGDASGVKTAGKQAADATEDSADQMTAALKRAADSSRASSQQFASSFAMIATSAREAAAETNEALEAIEAKLGAVQKAFSTLGEVAIAGAAGEWIAEQIKSIGEYGDSVEHAAEQTGIATDRIQELAYVGGTAGVSAQQMTNSMGLLSRQLAAAQGGSKEAAQAFQLVGISLDQIKNESVDQVLSQIAESFSQHADGANKAALAMQLFGRSGRELIPVLDQGSAGFDALAQHAMAAGAVIDADTIEAMSQLGTHISELTQDADALGHQFGGALAPALDAVVQAIDELITDDDGIREVFEGIAEGLKAIIAVIYTAIVGFKQFGDVLSGVMKSSYDLGAGNLKQAWDDIATGASKANAEGEKYATTMDKLYGEKPDAGIDYGNTENKKPSFGAVNRGGDSGNTGKGEIAIAQATSQAALESLKESLTEEAQQNEAAYKDGQVTLQAYYATRLQIEQSGLQAEAAVKRQELSAVTAQEGSAQNAGQALELKAREITITGQLAVLNQKYAYAAVQNQQQLTDAERQQTNQLAVLAAQQAVTMGGQDITRQKDQLDAQVEMGQTSGRQQLAVEAQLEDQMYALKQAELAAELQAVQQEKGQESVEYQKAYDAIETAASEHQTKLTELSLQGAEDQGKAAQQASTDIQGAFEQLFTNLSDGSKNLKTVFMDFFNTLDKDISQLMSKFLVNSLLGSGTEGGSLLGGLTKSIFGVAGGDAGQGAGSSSGIVTQLGKALGLNSGTAGGVGTAAAGMTGVSAAQTVAAMTVTSMTVGTMASLGGTSGIGAGGGLFGGSFGSGGSEAAGAADSSTPDDLIAGFSDTAAAYAQGTAYVPQTGLAMIHKGEAIIPAQYNQSASSRSVVVTNNFSLGQATDLRTQQQVAAMAASGLGRASRRNG